jgi:hypothetical protein
MYHPITWVSLQTGPSNIACLLFPVSLATVHVPNRLQAKTKMGLYQNKMYKRIYFCDEKIVKGDKMMAHHIIAIKPNIWIGNEQPEIMLPRESASLVEF